MTKQLNFTGIGGYSQAATPRIIPYFTTDTYATIIGAGYLNTVQDSNLLLSTDIINASYSGGSGFFTVSIAADKAITLAPQASMGEVILPVVSGNFSVFSGTTGVIVDLGYSPSNAAKTRVVMANGATTIGDLATYTDITGTVGDTSPILSDYQTFVPLTNILINSVGTWTRTRVATSNYSLVHTAANDTSVIGIDITAQLRAAASKGFQLASIDVVYSIATLALDAHTMVLSSVVYANNAAVTVTNIPLTGTLATATQAQPYVTNLAVTTPAYLNTAVAKYNVELTVDAAATGLYSFYGLNLHFTQTIT